MIQPVALQRQPFRRDEMLLVFLFAEAKVMGEDLRGALRQRLAALQLEPDVGHRGGERDTPAKGLEENEQKPAAMDVPAQVEGKVDALKLQIGIERIAGEIVVPPEFAQVAEMFAQGLGEQEERAFQLRVPLDGIRKEERAHG